MHYTDAKKQADDIVSMLAPYCQLIHIAGSIRRQQWQVKDIEIICLPHRLFVPTDLFGGGKWEVNSGFQRAVKTITHKRVKGDVNGRYMQLVLISGAVLDLFMPQEHDYVRQLAIRTGPAEYSSNVLAYGWKRLGWCGTEEGLRRRIDCDEVSDKKYVCTNKDGEKPPHWKSELEFFEWLGIKWVEPKERQVKSFNNTYPKRA